MPVSLLRNAALFASAATAFKSPPLPQRPTIPSLPRASGRFLPLTGPRHSLQVVCMAHPRRVARVAKQLEREIGMLLLTDPALRAAVSPPSREREHSGSLTGIASISEVELTSNLQLARVYVSVYADAENRAPAMRALERLQPYVRRRVASAMRLRSVPEIRFLADDSVEAGEQVEAALELARLRAAGLAEPPPIVPSTRMGGALKVEGGEWKPRSSFPDVGAAFDEGILGSLEDEEEEGDESDDEDDEDDKDDDDDDDDDGFLDLGPSSDRASSSSKASSSVPSRARAAAAATASAASSQLQQQQSDSFFGFEPPPLEGFWPGGDVPGSLGIRRITAGAARGGGGGEDEDGEEMDLLGDGVLGPDGIVRLAPGSRGGGGGGGGGSGGGRKPQGGGGKPRQRPQRRR